MELEWSSGRPRFITMGSTQIFMRTRRGVYVSGDFQIGPKTTGLQRSLISVGQVADRGNSMVFRRSSGTLFNKVTGTQIKFERAGGVYRQKGRDIITESDWDRWNQDADGLRARVHGTFGGTTCDTWNRTNSTDVETEVERLATPSDTPTMSKLVSPLRTCQGQR